MDGTVMPASQPKVRHAVLWPCVAVGACVIALVVARAILVPVTFDEVVTYERNIAADPGAMFDFRTATNHLLNTALVRISHALFGSEAWALRLPNILAGLGYLAALAALALRTRHGLVAVAGFTLLATNLYVLDYFAQSRGYGLAIALVTGSMYYLLRWLDAPAEGKRAPLVTATALAVVAVTANFAVLPALFGLVGVALLHLLGTPAPVLQAAPRRWRPWVLPVVWLVVTALFSLLVFSRDRALSQDLFAPLSVRVVGLFDDELSLVEVYRQDVNGRLRPLQREPGGAWHTDAVRDAWGLRVELPASVENNLAMLEVDIGGRVYRRTRREAGPWLVYDSGPNRVLRSDPSLAAPRSAVPALSGAINWVSDAGQWRLAAAYTGVTLAVLALLAAALAVLRMLAARARRLTSADAPALSWALLWAAGLCAAPLYLMRRNRQLYFGGTTGLVADTLTSLVDGTAYDRVSTPEVVLWVAALLALAAVVTVIAFLTVPRLRIVLRAPLALLGVVGIVILQSRLQHDLLDTPLPLGRTALFLVPLTGLFLWCLADALAAWGRALRAVVSALMVGLALVSGWHAATAANTVRTFDDLADVSTPAMLAAVAGDVAATASPTAIVHISVDPIFLPVARYYAARQKVTGTRYLIHGEPTDGVRPDYFYVVGSRPGPDNGRRVSDFPLSNAVLWRAGAGR